MRTPRLGIFALLVLSAFFMLLSACAPRLAPGPQSDGTGVTPQGWQITPTGVQTELGPGPLAVANTPDGKKTLVVQAGLSEHALLVIDASGKIVQRLAAAGKQLPDDAHSFGYDNGLVIAPAGDRAFVSDGTGSAIDVFRIGDAVLRADHTIILKGPDGARVYPTGLAITHDGRMLVVSGGLDDSVYIISTTDGETRGRIRIGHLPYGVAVSADDQRAVISSWGGNTVSLVDLRQGRLVRQVQTGTHPNAIVASPTRAEFYVANADSDSVSVLDSGSGLPIRTIAFRHDSTSPLGASPDALTVSPDGKFLYVALALQNAVAVVAIGAPDRIIGLIPTGWYPSGLAFNAPTGSLNVINMKGLGVGPAAAGREWTEKLHGSLSTIQLPGPAALLKLTASVGHNDRIGRPSPGGGGYVIPAYPGQGSPIKHIIYILKENRTYDQVLGDLGKGNGDPMLTLFGADVTPNTHLLARKFVLLDNFYADGEVSVDGWSWSNGAYANTYVEKNWPLEYGGYGHPDDLGGFGSSEKAGLPGESPGTGFLWDRLNAAGISYRNFGFFVNNPPIVDSSMYGLLGRTDTEFPGWDLTVQDQVRADRWLQVFSEYNKQNAMPTMQFIALPGDHTSATEIGRRTPRAYVADNDLAVGRIVDAVSHSQFWADTAIFIVEDDAQDGPDHVDGHRTVALIISPYTQTGRTDSTFYSTVSMLKTMELIVGVGPLSVFDATAKPMLKSFSSVPNLSPYTHVPPSVDLRETNATNAVMANESAALDFSKADRVPDELMNLILWQSVKGPGTHPPRRAAD